jgi:hypothetical protein
LCPERRLGREIELFQRPEFTGKTLVDRVAVFRASSKVTAPRPGAVVD